MKEIRCFISSPGDVGQERLLAVRVIERLAVEFGQRFKLTPIVWEHEPLRASEHFQSQIIPPSQTDVVVCILWSRLGTRLPEQFRRPDGTTYESGTEWEFEDALEAYRRNGTPDLLVYRKTADPITVLKSRESLLLQLAQKESLDHFIDRWFGNPTEGFRAAFHNFSTADQFERLLETHLRRFLIDTVGAISDAPTGPKRGTWHRGTPFRGLKPFDVEHAEIFFGRTRAIGELKNQLMRQAEKGTAFLLLIGMSGSGKSSLVRAGLLPTLTVPGVVEGVGLWRWGITRPADSPHGPTASLAQALIQGTALPDLANVGFSAATAGELLSSQPQLMIEPIRVALQTAAQRAAEVEKLEHPPTAKLLLVIDQLEEIFTSSSANDIQRRQFGKAIETLASCGHVWVVATMRSDFFARLASAPELVNLKAGEGQYDLLPPNTAEIEQMIQYPARVAGVGFEIDDQANVGLDKMILESASKSPESLPLLEFTLDELYKRRERELLTLAAYRQLGGLEGAIAQRAEEVLQSLAPEVQSQLPNLFRACITLSAKEDHSVGTIRVPLSRAAVNKQARELVDAFVDARLLVLDRDHDGNETVGLAHEALLRHWPRLTQWLAENIEFFRVRGQVTVAAESWRNSARNPDYLLQPGKPLVDGESLLAARDQLSPQLVEFIEESGSAARRQSQRRRVLVGVIVTSFLALATGFSAYSFAQWRRAEILKGQADDQRDLANLREKEAISERAEAVKQKQIADEQRNLAIEREGEANKRRTEAELAQKSEAAAREQEKQEREAKEKALEEAQQALALADFNLMFRNPMIADQQWSRTELTAARARLEQTPPELRFWEWHHVNRKCHQELSTTKLDGKPQAVAFSPKGSRLAVAVDDDPALIANPRARIEIWDWIKRERLYALTGLNQAVAEMVLLERGSKAVSISSSELIEWDVDKKEIVRRTELANPKLVALSANGEFAAMAWERGDFDAPSMELVVWDVAEGKRRTSWERTGQLGQALALSADGSLVAVATGYSGVVCHEVDAETPVFEVNESDSTQVHRSIFSVAISQDEKRLAVGGYDGALKVFDLEKKEEYVNLFGHDNAIVNVRFFEDSGQLFSNGWDATVRVWDVENGRETQVLRGHEDWIIHAAASFSGNTMASISRDGQLKFWDLRSEHNSVLRFPNAAVFVDGIAWSKTARIWLAAATDVVGRLITGDVASNATFVTDNLGGGFVARAPDGITFATNGGFDESSSVILYRMSTEERFGSSPDKIVSLEGHGDAVTCGLFTSDRQLVTAGLDRAVRIWDLDSQTTVRTFECPSPIRCLAFDPVRQLLFIGMFGGRLEWFDLQTGVSIGSAQFDGNVTAVAVRPGGGLVSISAGYYQEPCNIYLYDLASNSVIGTLRGHTHLVNCLAFTPDGSRLASASDDRSIKIWDVDARLEALTLWGHPREVATLAFDEPGHKLVSGDKMGTVIVWDGTPISSK